MAFPRRGGPSLNAPKVVTFSISLILAIVAVASLYTHLPAGASFVNAHRFWIVVTAYVLLALGCILRGL